MTLEDLKKDFDEKLAAMSDEEIIADFDKLGCCVTIGDMKENNLENSEFVDGVRELAQWEGCEVGDLLHTLLDTYESYSSYVSDGFEENLREEILLHYSNLKIAKREEDMEKEINESERISICASGFDMSFTVNDMRDENNEVDDKKLADVLEECARMLRAKVEEDPEIF